MKRILCTSALLLLCGFTSLANAASTGFSGFGFRVGDPPSQLVASFGGEDGYPNPLPTPAPFLPLITQGVPITINGAAGSSFGGCDSILGVSPVAGDTSYCLVAFNNIGDPTITSLSVSLGAAAFPAGVPIPCSTFNVALTPASCGLSGSTYDFAFTGGGIRGGSSLILVLDVPLGATDASGQPFNPSDVMGTAVAGSAGTTAVTPEPNSLILLASGLLSAGRLVYTRRRK